ncbi:unnamed protein product [Urochloa humidicola]
MDEAAVCTKPAVDAVMTTEEKVAPRREEQEQPQPAAPLEVQSDGEEFEWEDQSEDEDDESAESFMALNNAVIRLFREQEKERLRDLYSPERAKAMSVIRSLREKEAHLIRSTPLDEVAKPRKE